MEGLNILQGLDLDALDKATQGKSKPADIDNTGLGDFTNIPLEGNEVIEEVEEKEETEDTETESVTESNEIEEKEEDTQEETNEGSVHKLIAELFKEKGVLSEIPEDFEESDEGLATVIDKELEKRANSLIEDYKESLPEEVKRIIENYEEGVSVSKLLEYEREIEDYSSIDPEAFKENESLQKAIIQDYLERTDWTVEEIKEKIQDLEDSGLLEKEAKRSLSKLVSHQEAEKKAFVEAEKNRQREAKERYQKDLTALETKINEKEEVLPGIKWSKDDKKKVYKALTTVVGKDKAGRPVNAIGKYLSDNPDFQLVIADLIVLREGKLDTITKAVETKVTKKLKQDLDKPTPKSKLSGVDLDVVKSFLKRK